MVASVENTSIGASSNEKGEIILSAIPDGPQQIAFYLVGYTKSVLKFNFPQKNPSVIIYLTSSEKNLEEIVVSSTRTNSRIDDLQLY